MNINLPFSRSSLSLHPPHPDLINEPFSFNDSGIRPEMKLERSFFSFKIIEGDTTHPSESELGRAICCVEDKIVSMSVSDTLQVVPKKSSSTFSLVSVYDSYGLEATYAFLQHLYYNEHHSWISTYVAGSLLILHPKLPSYYLSEDNTLNDIPLPTLCSVLMTGLASLDSYQPKMPEELISVDQDLPLEILAKIINSKRVSKKIAALLFKRNLSPLSQAELIHQSYRPRVMTSDNLYWLVDMECYVGYEWRITTSSPYTLECISARDIPPGGDYLEMDIELTGSETPIQFSVYNYIEAYNARDLDGTKMTIDLLRSLNEQLDLMKILAWILVLCHDMRIELKTKEMKFLNLGELLIFRDSLVEKMINVLQQDN